MGHGERGPRGLFDYELDLMNIVEVTDLMAATTWVPGEGFVLPPPNPNRNPTPRRLDGP